MISAARKFTDGSSFFELRKHFQQGAIVGFLEMEAATDILRGGGVCPNLQKTKDVIGAQVRGASHKWGPEGGGRRARRILLIFFRGTRNFFRGKGLHTAGQHTTGCPPSVRAVGHSPKGELGRRDDLARLSFFISALFLLLGLKLSLFIGIAFDLEVPR